jgi:uncharacterized protein (TIGR03083 family)
MSTTSQRRLTFHEQCDGIVARADLLRDEIAGADPATPVPSCPGWTINQLVRHLGGGHAWAEEIVRTRAARPPSDNHFRDLSGYTGEDPAVLGAWLVKGAGQLADTLRAAGPDAPLWTPVAGGTAAFYARRFAHETLIHGADATLALGRPVVIDESVARDAVEEWLELGSLPEMLDFHPRQRELLGPGRTIRLHATDVPADWIVDLTGDGLAWRRSDEAAAVTVSAPLTDLLLILYRRRPVRAEDVDGDAALVDFWLDRVAFG